jgi:hypothetical protein
MRNILIFTFISICSFGQDNKWEDKYNGYVVTMENVRIKGYLRLETGDLTRGKKILLLKKPNDNPQIFYSLELKGYVYKKDTFKIIQNLQPYLDDTKVIERAEAKIIDRGKLTLLEIPVQYYSTTPVVGVRTVGAMRTLKTDYTYVIADTKNEFIGIKNENFIYELSKLLSDAPDILERINRKELKFRNLEKIVKEYNKRFR